MKSPNTSSRGVRGRMDAAGFTLIELMVVIVIIGMLAAIVVPKFMGAADTAAIASAKAQISSFKTALQLYKLDNGSYPKTGEGLESLLRNDKGKNYLEQDVLPKDPWGNAYIYSSPGQNGHDYEIVSLGADGAPGGEGGNSDLQSWNLQSSK